MVMSENKNPPLSEKVEFDAVDLEKQPKRVRKAEANPPTRKKSTPAKKTFSKVEKNIDRGTKKKLLPLPFEVAKKKPFKGRKIVKPNLKGIEKKDPRKRDFSRKPTFNPEITEKPALGKRDRFCFRFFRLHPSTRILHRDFIITPAGFLCRWQNCCWSILAKREGCLILLWEAARFCWKDFLQECRWQETISTRSPP